MPITLENDCDLDALNRELDAAAIVPEYDDYPPHRPGYLPELRAGWSIDSRVELPADHLGQLAGSLWGATADYAALERLGRWFHAAKLMADDAPRLCASACVGRDLDNAGADAFWARYCPAPLPADDEQRSWFLFYFRAAAGDAWRGMRAKKTR